MNIYTKKNNFLWKKISMSIFALIILIGFLNIFQAQIKNTFYTITYPISNVFWRAGDSVGNLLGSFLNVKGLAQENNNLKQENQDLLSKVSSLQEIVKVNQSIK